MKHVLLPALAAVLVATAAPALAQTHPTASPAMRQQFERMHTQMEQIRQTERSQMLGALTPAHRALLSSVAGQLTTSTNPDYRAAAARLDAALSPAEKQAVLAAAKSWRQKMMTLMKSMPKPSGAAALHHPETNRMRHHRTPDAGMLLLRLSAPGGGMMTGHPR
jgi:hypothetical protein